MTDPTTQTVTELAKKHGLAALLPIALWLAKDLVLWFIRDWKESKSRDTAERLKAIDDLHREREARVTALERDLAETKEENERLVEKLTALESQLQSVLSTSLNDARRFRDAHERLQRAHSELLLEMAKQSHIQPRRTTPTPR